MSALIEFEQVCKYYQMGDTLVKAADHITMKIEKGEFVVSMVRRGSVVVSFLCGAVLFRERNLRSKAVDLAFILVGMFFLWLGSRPA